MSLSLQQLLTLLAAAQMGEVAPALADESLGAADRNYAAGSTQTTALLLILASAEAAAAPAREAAAAAAAQPLVGEAATTRDTRHAALGRLLEAAEQAGDRDACAAVWRLLRAEAEAELAAFGLPLV